MPGSTPSRVNLIFPIENINRELDWRLLLACTHARPTNRIFVGQHDVLFRMITKTGMRGGVYVGKHLFRQRPAFKDYERYRAIKAMGFLVVHLDEEGAVYDGDEERWRWWLLCGQLDPRCLDAEDYLCTWGDFQREFYRSLEPACADHITTTGHPRFELYKAAYRKYFAADAAAITARFGEYILVNTHVAYGNNALGLADTFSPRLGYHPDNPEERAASMARYSYELRVIGAFVRLVNRLSLTYPSVNIVLRPHPSEDWEYYRSVFRGVPNVHVVHEGPVAPWLLSCKLLLHTGCTTALEAHLADCPIVNYKAGNDPAQEIFLTELFGVECCSEDDVMKSVATVMSGEALPPLRALDPRARALMANFDHDCTAAFLRLLNEAEGQRAHVPQEWDSSRIRRVERARRVVERAKSLVRPLFALKQKQYAAMRSHFVRLDRAAIERKIATIEAMIGRRMNVTFYSPELLSIEAAD